MEIRGKRLLTVRQFCTEYPWPSESALRAIILDEAWGKKMFKNVFKRVNRRVLVDEEAFWKAIDAQQLEKPSFCKGGAQ